jgi:hypothetical protein
MADVKMGSVTIKQVGAPSVKSRPPASQTGQENPIRRPGNVDKTNRTDLSKTYIKGGS